MFSNTSLILSEMVGFSVNLLGSQMNNVKLVKTTLHPLLLIWSFFWWQFINFVVSEWPENVILHYVFRDKVDEETFAMSIVT